MQHRPNMSGPQFPIPQFQIPQFGNSQSLSPEIRNSQFTIFKGIIYARFASNRNECN